MTLFLNGIPTRETISIDFRSEVVQRGLHRLPARWSSRSPSFGTRHFTSPSLAPAIPCYSWPGTVPGPWHRAALGRLAPATPRKRTLWAPLALCRDFAAPFRLGSQKRWRRQPCSGRVALQQAGAHKLRALSIEARPTRGQRPQQQRKTSTYRYRLLFTCQKRGQLIRQEVS